LAAPCQTTCVRIRQRGRILAEQGQAEDLPSAVGTGVPSGGVRHQGRGARIDGYRLIVRRDGEMVRLFSHNAYEPAARRHLNVRHTKKDAAISSHHTTSAPHLPAPVMKSITSLTKNVIYAPTEAETVNLGTKFAAQPRPGRPVATQRPRRVAGRVPLTQVTRLTITRAK
jgi:hypothetical protein